MRVLVFWEEEKLKPTGGPNGYNYVLKKGLKEIGEDNIEYLPPGIISKTSRTNYTGIKKVIRQVKSHYELFVPYDEDLFDLSEYDIVHFHTSLHLYKARKMLRKYNGIVLLTSHSPQLLSEEFAERVPIIARRLMPFSFRALRKMDDYSFERADYILFPCAEAEQPYENWKTFATVKKERKIRYLLTGTTDNKLKLVGRDFRKEFGIPSNAFVVSYVGRHNVVKGYSDLKRNAETILEKYENVYFLIGGKEEPIKGLSHERWIEVGWTTQAADLISSSDLFVLPNKQTYFDLVLLEVLSLGIPVLASYTGGNRYFESINDSGIVLYHSDDDFCSKLGNIIQGSIVLDGTNNRMLYEERFSEVHFAKDYISLLEQIWTNR